MVKVPGSWEVPLVAGELARQQRYDAIICLGAVIRGETPHFDYVAGEAAKGHRARLLRHRRAGGLRRADYQYAGAGHRPRRRQGRQQGIRRRHDRDRNGESMQDPPAGTVMASRRRSRQRALQILFLWDARRQPVEAPSTHTTTPSTRKRSPSATRSWTPGARHGRAPRPRSTSRSPSTPSTGAWSGCPR